MSLHSRASGTALHENKRYKREVRAVATVAVSIPSPGLLIDGAQLAAGDRVLLAAQSNSTQNGIYVWNGSSVSMSRATDLASASDFKPGLFVYVRDGISQGSIYVLTTIDAVIVGTTPLTFQSISTIGPLGPEGPTGPSGIAGAKGDIGPPVRDFEIGYVLVQDQKASPSDGQFITAGAYRTRELTKLATDVSGIALLLSNQLTLPAGQYRATISCPLSLSGGSGNQSHTTRLQNISAGTTLLSGTTEVVADDSTFIVTRSWCTGRFTLLSPSALEIQHRSSVGGPGGEGTTLFGTTTFIYTIGEFWLLADSPPIGIQLTPRPVRDTRVFRHPARFPSNTILPV